MVSAGGVIHAPILCPAAQELQGGSQGLPEGAPANGSGEPLPQGLPPVQENELVDETLPTA